MMYDERRKRRYNLFIFPSYLQAEHLSARLPQQKYSVEIQPFLIK